MCQITTYCVVASSEDDCFDNKCSGNCVAASYDANNGACVIYSGCCPEDQPMRRRSVFEPLRTRNLVERDVAWLIKKPGVDID